MYVHVDHQLLKTLSLSLPVSLSHSLSHFLSLSLPLYLTPSLPICFTSSQSHFLSYLTSSLISLPLSLPLSATGGLSQNHSGEERREKLFHLSDDQGLYEQSHHSHSAPDIQGEQ